MSLTFKLLSLAIRTAAKPIGNYIKRQAKEHDGFRRFAVSQAQCVHRIDMRMRLGILHDPAAQERMHEREQRAAEEAKRKSEPSTVRTEEEQKLHDEEQAKAKEAGAVKAKEESKVSKIKIRPLSEAKAIELGANFFSEAFIFAVAAGLLIWDSWRSRRKELNRRDMVADRLESLELEVDRLRGKYEPGMVVERDMGRMDEKDAWRWYNPVSWWTKTEPDRKTDITAGVIPGDVPGEKAIKPAKPKEIVVSSHAEDVRPLAEPAEQLRKAPTTGTPIRSQPARTDTKTTPIEKKE